MKWVLIVAGSIAALVALVAIVGVLLPVSHAAARSIRLAQPPAAVFAAITDVKSMPGWRKGLESVELLEPRDGRRCYREVSSFGPMDLLVETEEPDRLLVQRIVTENSPFGGTWTYRLEPDGTGTRLCITENGEAYNVFFRALSRFVFGHTSTIDGYLTSLAAHFGDLARPEPAEPDPLPSAAD